MTTTNPGRELTAAERLLMQYVLMSIPPDAAEELKLALEFGNWLRVIEIVSQATQDTVTIYRRLLELFEANRDQTRGPVLNFSRTKK
jgi:hypothetical protein